MKNSVLLIGNLGKDPELKKLEGGNSVARFSLATNETFKNNKGEKVTTTQWHNCVLWGKTAELANTWLKKGKEIAARGKITYSNYEDKNGQVRYTTEIVVNEFTMLGAKPAN
ncbi:MAG: single-stranded DNA-binding protein [Saprospiraceae bacterium]|nr:single-stranded DNA-binding protein [Saprospiraceae bacterium]MCB9325469.1 single-stranded DNA-binding protein [Lewinellaceae bacterium]